MLLFFFSACKKEDITQYDCTGITPTYTANIKSILDANCLGSGCHSGSLPARGYNLSNYSGAKNASGKSAFLGSIQHKSGYSKMPKGGSQLSEADIKLVSCWVQNGAPE